MGVPTEDVHFLKELRGEIGGKLLLIHSQKAVCPTPRRAEEDLLAILRREVHADHPVQVHYFNGTKGAVDRWLLAFPHTHLSVWGTATTFTQQQREGLAHIPKDRLLLESDDPYAAPQTAPKGGTKRNLISHPYTLVQVAWVVAEVHHSAASIVLNQTAQNARRFFGLEDPSPREGWGMACLATDFPEFSEMETSFYVTWSFEVRRF